MTKNSNNSNNSSRNKRHFAHLRLGPADPHPSSNKRPKAVLNMFAEMKIQAKDPAPISYSLTPAPSTSQLPTATLQPPAAAPAAPPAAPPAPVAAPAPAPADARPRPRARAPNRRAQMSLFFPPKHQPQPDHQQQQQQQQQQHPAHRDYVVALSDTDQPDPPTSKKSSSSSSSSNRRRKASSAHASDENNSGGSKPKRARRHAPPHASSSSSSSSSSSARRAPRTPARAVSPPPPPQTPAPRPASLAPADPSTTRRASLARRGELMLKSTSSEILFPHRSIEPTEYYRHLGDNMSAVQRIKTLTLWVGKHVGGLVMKHRLVLEAEAAAQGSTGDDEVVKAKKMAAAKLAVVEAMAKLALKKMKKADEAAFDWALRPSKMPAQPNVLVKLRPNPENIAMAHKIHRLEYELDLLAQEKQAWMTHQADLMTRHAHLTDLTSAPRPPRTLDQLAHTLTPDELSVLTDPDPVALPLMPDDRASSVDALTRALETCTLAARTAAKLKTLRDVAAYKRAECGREMARYIEARFPRVPRGMNLKVMEAACRVVAGQEGREREARRRDEAQGEQRDG